MPTFFKARAFGGDNGMAGTTALRSHLARPRERRPGLCFRLSRWWSRAVVYLVLLLLRRSPFGMMLGAIHQQREPPCRAGLSGEAPTSWPRSRSPAGWPASPGPSPRRHTGFVSPDLAFWTLSGRGADHRHPGWQRQPDRGPRAGRPVHPAARPAQRRLLLEPPGAAGRSWPPTGNWSWACSSSRWCCWRATGCTGASPGSSRAWQAA